MRYGRSFVLEDRHDTDGSEQIERRFTNNGHDPTMQQTFLGHQQLLGAVHLHSIL
jgi:hypothetical protein